MDTAVGLLAAVTSNNIVWSFWYVSEVINILPRFTCSRRPQQWIAATDRLGPICCSHSTASSWASQRKSGTDDPQHNSNLILPGPSPGFSSSAPPMGGQKTNGGAKNQKGGGTFFKYCIGCMQQPGGQTWNGGSTDFKWGAGHHCPPRWRWPWILPIWLGSLFYSW